jgi:hypothetical protein
VSADTTAEILSAGERLAAIVPTSAVDLEVASRLYAATTGQKYAVLAAAIALTERHPRST